ncbi:MAG TPA: hypothetical protein VIM86_14100 [Thermodesulfobacteriota bacterium]
MTLAALGQWLHLGAAVAAVGGVLYLRVVLLASLRAVPAEQRAIVLEAAGRRFHPILWASIAILIVTGLQNVALGAAAHAANPLYWRLLGLKVVLALVLFALALGLSLPLPALAGLKRRRPQVLVVNLLLAAAILLLSAMLRRL